MAGGVWWLCASGSDWIDNPELGPVAFQFGTRPAADPGKPDLRRVEAPAADPEGGRRAPQPLLARPASIRPRSATPSSTSCSSARERQVAYSQHSRSASTTAAFPVGARGRLVYLTAADKVRAEQLGGRRASPRRCARRNSTLIFVTPEKENEIRTDQINCMGCLSRLHVLQLGAERAGHHRQEGRPAQLLHPEDAAGRSATPTTSTTSSCSPATTPTASRSDPFYANGFIPTVKQLVERLVTGY